MLLSKKLKLEAATLAVVMEHALFAAPHTATGVLAYASSPVVPLVFGYADVDFATLIANFVYVVSVVAFPYAAVAYHAKWMLLAYNFSKVSRHGPVNGVLLRLLWATGGWPWLHMLCACGAPWLAMRAYVKMDVLVVMLQTAARQQPQ